MASIPVSRINLVNGIYPDWYEPVPVFYLAREEGKRCLIPAQNNSMADFKATVHVSGFGRFKAKTHVNLPKIYFF